MVWVSAFEWMYTAAPTIPKCSSATLHKRVNCIGQGWVARWKITEHNTERQVRRGRGVWVKEREREGEKKNQGELAEGILESHLGTPWVSMGLISGGVFFKILVFLCFIRLSQGTFHLVLQFIYASQNCTVNRLP